MRGFQTVVIKLIIFNKVFLPLLSCPPVAHLPPFLFFHTILISSIFLSFNFLFSLSSLLQFSFHLSLFSYFSPFPHFSIYFLLPSLSVFQYSHSFSCFSFLRSETCRVSYVRLGADMAALQRTTDVSVFECVACRCDVTQHYISPFRSRRVIREIFLRDVAQRRRHGQLTNLSQKRTETRAGNWDK